jgi:elongation factor P
MTPASDLRPGMVVRLGGELYRVVSAEYHAGGGKMPGAVHAKLRSLRTTSYAERRFRPEERLEEVELERRPMEFLYEEGGQYTFMDPETFEQVSIPSEALGAFVKFISPNQSLQVGFVDGQPVEVRYPDTVALRVASTAEPMHQQHDTSVYKSATLENGMEVLVPPFIKVGDLVKIEVDTGKYLERVK